MKKRLLIPVVLSVLALTACSSTSQSALSKSPVSGYENARASKVSLSSNDMLMDTGSGDGLSEGLEVLPDAENTSRKLIRRVDLSFSIPNSSLLADSVGQISDTVSKMGGYIESNDSSYGDYASGNLSVKIPTNKTDEFIEEIKGQEMKLKNYSDSVEDVTLQYVDVKARLRVKEEAKEKYEEYLKNASSIDESLSIEKELTSIIADIESYQSQLNILENQIDYTSISIFIDCDVSEEAQGFLARFKDAMSDFGIEIGDTFIDALCFAIKGLIRVVFVLPIIFTIIKTIMLALGKTGLKRKGDKKGINEIKQGEKPEIK